MKRKHWLFPLATSYPELKASDVKVAAELGLILIIVTSPETDNILSCVTKMCLRSPLEG